MDYKRKYLKYKQKYLELQKNIFGGAENEDGNGALILDNSGNDNGSNYCWLNAPLYAFVAFKDVVDLYKKNFCILKDDPKKVLENERPIYDNLHNLMLKAREKETVWNDSFYEEIHTELCKISKCGNDGDLREVGKSNFSNPLPVIDIFKNVLVNKCPDTESPLYVETFNTKVSDFNDAEVLGDNQGRKLIAIVKGNGSVDEISDLNNKDINVKHFVAYVRSNDNDLWKEYNLGKTEEEYKNTLDDIFPKNENDKYWLYFGIYFDKNRLPYINQDPTEEISKSEQAKKEEELLAQLEPEVKKIEPDVKEVKEIKPEVKEIETEVKEIKPDVKEIKPDVKEIETEVKGIKPEVKVTETKQKRTLGGIETPYKSFPLMTPTEFANNKDYLPNIVKPF